MRRPDSDWLVGTGGAAVWPSLVRKRKRPLTLFESWSARRTALPPELLVGSVDCARDQVNGTVVLFGRHQASGARNGSELGLSRVGLAAFFSEPAKLMLRVQDV